MTLLDEGHQCAPSAASPIPWPFGSSECCSQWGHGAIVATIAQCAHGDIPYVRIPVGSRHPEQTNDIPGMFHPRDVGSLRAIRRRHPKITMTNSKSCPGRGCRCQPGAPDTRPSGHPCAERFRRRRHARGHRWTLAVSYPTSEPADGSDQEVDAQAPRSGGRPPTRRPTGPPGPAVRDRRRCRPALQPPIPDTVNLENTCLSSAADRTECDTFVLFFLPHPAPIPRRYVRGRPRRVNDQDVDGHSLPAWSR